MHAATPLAIAAPEYTTYAVPLEARVSSASVSNSGTAAHANEHRVAPRGTKSTKRNNTITVQPRCIHAGPCIVGLIVLVAAVAIVLGPWRSNPRRDYAALLAAYAWPALLTSAAAAVVLAIAARSVLYQSITTLPGLGVQLTTTRGIAGVPLSKSRSFVSLDNIATVIIHEGLRRWNVRYYLAIVQKNGPIVVAFDSVNPRPAVLREVYHSVREALFDEYT